MREDVHAGGIEVAEPGSAVLGLAVDEVECAGDELFVDGLHPLLDLGGELVVLVRELALRLGELALQPRQLAARLASLPLRLSQNSSH